MFKGAQGRNLSSLLEEKGEASRQCWTCGGGWEWQQVWVGATQSPDLHAGP